MEHNQTALDTLQLLPAKGNGVAVLVLVLVVIVVVCAAP